MARRRARVGEGVDGLDDVVRVDDLEEWTAGEGLAVVDEAGGVTAGVDDDPVVVEEGNRFGEVLKEGLGHSGRGIRPVLLESLPKGVALHGEVVHVVLCSVGSAGPERVGAPGCRSAACSPPFRSPLNVG